MHTYQTLPLLQDSREPSIFDYKRGHGHFITLPKGYSLEGEKNDKYYSHSLKIYVVLLSNLTYHKQLNKRRKKPITDSAQITCKCSSLDSSMNIHILLEGNKLQLILTS